MRRAIFSLLLLSVMSGTSNTQVNFRGQVAASFLKSGRTDAPRAIDNGHPTFGWETDLFLDALIGDRVAVLSSYRVDQTERLFFDYVAIRVMHLTPADLTLQVGKFDMPFGNLGERRFPGSNALYGLPLLYDYRTPVQTHYVTESAMAAARGYGAGLSLLDAGMYDIGAEVYGAWGIFTYALAVENGTVSTPAYGNQNSNNDVGKILRCTATPLMGLTIVAGITEGAYLNDAYNSAASGADFSRYRQRAGELDVAFSTGHLVLYGEGVYGSWDVEFADRDETLGMFGYYGEGKYALSPRLYVALRMNGLVFQKVRLGGIDQRWDYNVNEWEGGFGYYLDRDVLLKAVRRETRTYGGSRPKDYLTVAQLAVLF